MTAIHLGTQLPLIQRVSQPYVDERGLWLDVDIVYGGGFTMTLETKVNLMKLKHKRGVNADDDDARDFIEIKCALILLSFSFLVHVARRELLLLSILMLELNLNRLLD